MTATPDFAALSPNADSGRMSPNADFAAIIQATLAYENDDALWQSDLAAEVLAAPIAAMCPDCKGRGWFIDMDDMGCERTCTHPNAPTIGGALTEWADAHQRAATKSESEVTG